MEGENLIYEINMKKNTERKMAIYFSLVAILGMVQSRVDIPYFGWVSLIIAFILLFLATKSMGALD